jgi:autotransporter-associated beta strand protein
MTVPGAITGSGGLTTTSATATNITLSGANTYSGGTTVNGGTLNANGATPLGATTGPLSVKQPQYQHAGNQHRLEPLHHGADDHRLAERDESGRLSEYDNDRQRGHLFTVNQTTADSYAGSHCRRWRVCPRPAEH